MRSEPSTTAEGIDLEREVRKTGALVLMPTVANQAGKAGLQRRRELTRSARPQAGALVLMPTVANQAGKAGLVAAEGIEPTRGVTPGRF
jgi:hypothetical protein